MIELLKILSMRFSLFLILASFFHYLALICIVFLIIKYKVDFFYKYRFLLIFLVIAISNFILLIVSSYYSRYAAYATLSNADSIGFALMGFYIFTFIINDIFSDKIKIYHDYFKFFVVIFSFYIALQLSFLINDINNYGTTRLIIYFLWPSVFIWGIFLKNINDINVKIFSVIVFSMLLFLYWCIVISGSGYSIVPFKYSIF